MDTKVIEITRDMPEWDTVTLAAGVIGSGGIVCFPTDTVYGFAASVFSEDALRRLRLIKERGANAPFVVIADDLGWISELTEGVTAAHKRLMAEYWPGPLTIIFKTSPSLPDYVTGEFDTVALRIPNDTLSQSLLRACGIPLVAPSANPRGKRAPVSPEEVLQYFDGKIDLLLDGGPLENAQPSTIVAVKRGRVVVLREGRVPVPSTMR